MADEEMTLAEMGRSLRRLESTLNAFTNRADSVFVSKPVYDAQLGGLVEDVAELKERERFRARAVATAIVTALAGPILILFQVKK